MSAYEIIRTCDSNSNLIYYKDSKGYEVCAGYDSNNDLIYYKSSTGREEWYWEGVSTKDPVKILLLASQLHSKVSQ
jgi:hypothetical protein